MTCRLVPALTYFMQDCGGMCKTAMDAMDFVMNKPMPFKNPCTEKLKEPGLSIRLEFVFKLAKLVSDIDLLLLENGLILGPHRKL